MKIQRIKLPMLLLIGLTFSLSAQAGTAWRNAKWGMSEAEVLQAFPAEAKMLAKKEFSSDRKSYTSVAIDRVPVGSAQFKAHFMFGTDENQLIKIILWSLDGQGAPVLESNFSTIEQLLTKKYGQRSYNENDEDSGWKKSITKTSIWNLPETVIELNYLFIEDVTSVLKVSYSPAESSDQDTSNL